jgi:putative glutathione S-transferase
MSTTTPALRSTKNWITLDGSSPYAPEANRYHLYVADVCPFAHRALLGRTFKGLDHVVGLTVADSVLTSADGWVFKEPEPVHGFTRVRQLYELHDPNFTGTVTVPVLFDKHTNSIVSTESADILRMFGTVFDKLSATPEQRALELYPAGDDATSVERKAAIDATNEWVANGFIFATYKAHAAADQAAYDAALDSVYNTLARLEELLSRQRYLLPGNTVTEADLRLFVALVRFDTVAVIHMRVSRRLLTEYPNLWAYAREIYQHPGVAATVDFLDIRRGYSLSYKWRDQNPKGIVFEGFSADWTKPHGRGEVA